MFTGLANRFASHRPTLLNPKLPIMLHRRTSGILLHPTSLPGPYGIGDLGTAAFEFVDWLVAAGQSRWQVLPLGPTGYGDSPYASFSSFAGNPMMISLDRLVDDGDLEWSDVSPPADLRDDQVMFGPLIGWKMPLLTMAAERFLAQGSLTRRAAFENFCRQQASWLDDYALFIAVKGHFDARAAAEQHHGAMWNNFWNADIANRDPQAMEAWTIKLAHSIAIGKVLQYYFFSQWLQLKHYANDAGVRIIGDLPIFVAFDSVDVWAAPKQFMLDESNQATVVAGVPPDYFSETGQLWGNPLYNWDAMRADYFNWWVRRFEGTRTLVDIIRVDHFRGFEACWSVPAGEKTAVNGEWVSAPGDELFREIRKRLGDLPIVAEDLGLITPAVVKLRDDQGFPGMKVLQFAFDSKDAGARAFLPHNHEPNCIVYTGTHDNDTTVGWYRQSDENRMGNIEEYFGHTLQDPAWDFIRMALSSVGRTVVIPMQDVLGLGSETRMNRPSIGSGNWSWRMAADYRDGAEAKRLLEMVELYQRREV